MENRSGTWKNKLTGDAAYRSFAPAPLPPNPAVAIDAQMLDLLIQANKRIALLDDLSARLSNINLFLSMYVRKEALMSSQIEGTQATLEDILDPLLDENTNRDVADVVNYIQAMEFAVRRLNELPLCNRLIRETHAVLMQGVRGQEKTPGEFRYTQNWIGSQGGTIRNARYIPPAPDDMIDAMSDLEMYINRDLFVEKEDPLVRAALIHYQFETIHPFLDGNGRIGRLLVILFLINQNVLQKPALYISYFFKRNRIEYYDRLMQVRLQGDYEQWVKFFLMAALEAAGDAVDTLDKLIRLRQRNMARIDGMGRAGKNIKLVFQYIEANPIVDIRKTADALALSYNTIASAVSRLCEADILIQTENVRRNRIFSYEAYLAILREK